VNTTTSPYPTNTSASSSPQSTGDAAKQAVDQLKQGAIDGAREASDTAAREAARIGDLARDWWNRNAQVAMSAAATVKDEAASLGTSTQRYVRDEPVKSLLVAAAAGALITGLILMAARRDPR
jgi:ElaB/YqjD/DUF883 family membrane-anchored ribosome-binding protein